MSELKSAFVWERPAERNGFLWERPKFGSEEWLMRRRPDAHFIDYRPLEEYPTLFESFAATEPTLDGVLTFANNYGWLGVQDPHFRLYRGNAEHLALWKIRIMITRQLFHLWKSLVPKAKPSSLGDVIQWQGSHTIRFIPLPGQANYYAEIDPLELILDQSSPNMASSDWPPELEWFCTSSETWKNGTKEISLKNMGPGLWKVFRANNLIGPARFLLFDGINAFLWHNVTRAILRRDNQMIFGDCPKNLLGAIYLQFAQVVGGERQIKNCRRCGKSFEVGRGSSLGVSRSDRVFCSDNCNVRYSQDKKRRAQKLYEQGRSVEQIRKKVGARLDTVERWMATWQPKTKRKVGGRS